MKSEIQDRLNKTVVRLRIGSPPNTPLTEWASVPRTESAGVMWMKLYSNCVIWYDEETGTTIVRELGRTMDLGRLR